MADKGDAKLVHLNLDLGCDLRCDGCEKYLQCNAPEKITSYARHRMHLAAQVMEQIKHKIVVIGGKGGVGKSLITANLAAGLAMKGKKVTVLDQCFDAPVVSKMLGFSGKKLKVEKDGMVPAEGLLGIQMVSMGLVLRDDEVLTWFHDMKRSATEEFLCHVLYGQRDYLVVDVPAGTSSDTLNVLEYIPKVDGVVVVTIPSEVSQAVARRAVSLCDKAGAKVVGIIENMSGFVCPYCGTREYVMQRGGGSKLAERLGVPFIGEIPLDPRISECADAGIPFVYKFPEVEGSKVIMRVVQELEKTLPT